MTGVVLPFLWRGRGRLARLALWSVVEAAPAFTSGEAVAHATDAGFLAGRPLAGFAWLGGFALSALIGAYGTRRTYPLLADLVEPFRDHLVDMVVRGALRRSARYGEPADTGAVARLTQQVEIVREAFGGLVMVSRSVLFTIGAAAIGLASLDPVTLPLVLPPLLAGIGLFWALVPKVAARQRALVLADEAIDTASTTVVTGLRDVVACGAEDRVCAEIGRSIAEQARATRAVGGATALRDLSIAVGGLLPVLLVLLGAHWLTSRGATTGDIIGTLTYLLQAMLPALQTMTGGIGGSVVQLTVTLGRIVSAARVPEPVLSGPVSPSSPGDGSGRIDLRGVRFGYGRDAVPVLDGIDLTVPAGDHLAIVGPSGIGKSTVAGLLAGLLVPQSGEVLLDGVPAHRLTPAALARARVLIPQEAYVFSGRVRENLCYFDPDATDAELTSAIAELGAAALVDRLGGLDAELDPAVLSAGERQLIALVRAYLSPARIVLLDEATSQLDQAAEARAEAAFARRGGTLVVIAHRIGSALRANRILLMDGRSTMLGDHETLLRTAPLYRELVGRWEAGDQPLIRPGHFA